MYSVTRSEDEDPRQPAHVNLPFALPLVEGKKLKKKCCKKYKKGKRCKRCPGRMA